METLGPWRGVTSGNTEKHLPTFLSSLPLCFTMVSGQERDREPPVVYGSPDIDRHS